MATKKNSTPSTTVTRNLMDFSEQTGNVYESVLIMGKRANQISVDLKKELQRKLSEFGSKNDSLEEEFENREQIEISRFYERMPKPALLAEKEFLDGKVYFRNPNDEANDF
ncbi:MAG: DNA-directed RNA polymerase subunit omega [Bacteroidaceae bacterium]|nr:DNA-directed RNA polymerase subunit omega [Bacteroidaceae bacterium]